jgi:hypothetical protein
MSGLSIPIAAEAQRVLQHVDAVETILRKDKSVEERADEADQYMARVLEQSGRRVYEAVLNSIAAAKEIPPKDVRR